jgi:hypothetical protein
MYPSISYLHVSPTPDLQLSRSFLSLCKSNLLPPCIAQSLTSVYSRTTHHTPHTTHHKFFTCVYRKPLNNPVSSPVGSMRRCSCTWGVP